ncbi:MAG TPA: cytochrome b N-terminal domain-containing protein [Kofleriaceae bacterium]|nr:cytochrome b N-terminal domain-containing protein [Kofleriaceae bacterium]
MSIRDWLDERTGYRRAMHVALEEPVLGGASFAYVMGSVLVFLLILQATTGALLAFYYSPSATDAWGSVAYIEDQVTLGWFIRGLHHHGASAMVIAVGLHMLQVVVWGAYKKPREVTWWVGVLLLGLLLAFALTGYLLPWDQTGYWATKVATGIAGSSPGAGVEIQAALQGGNEYGNLTLTRFFALHVFVLPALTIGLVVVHVALFRKHGVTPRWGRSRGELERTAQPFWPDQLFRDVVAMAVAFAALVAWTIHTGGAGLDAPADPSSNFDARPEWYFRPLFELLKYVPGSLEAVVALGLPVVVGGALIALPLIDRGVDRSPRRRAWVIALVGAGFAGAAALTVMSIRADQADPELVKREAASAQQGRRARALAKQHGVPAAGGTAVYATAPFFRARALWAEHCAGCHAGAERKGPAIGPGYNDRAWIRGFLQAPSGDLYFGHTKLATSEDAMAPVEESGADLDALVEAIYAETGAADADPAKVARGRQLFDEGSCSDCHERILRQAQDSADLVSSGPNLAGRGSAPYLRAVIADAGAARFFGKHDEMPRFADELSADDIAKLATWLVWLRDASDADVQQLDE